MQLTDILVANGLIREEDLERASERQRRCGGRLGDNLVAVGAITQEHIQRVLDDVPSAPVSIASSGIDNGSLLRLLVKLIHVRGLETGSQFANELSLPAAVVSELLQEAGTRKLIASTGAEAFGELRYSLTEAGKNLARDALARNQYVGPAPVSLGAYEAQVRKQSIGKERIGQEKIFRSFSDLVMPEGFLDRLGPGINSGRCLLLYGPSGNGKSSVAKKIGEIFRDIIFVPYCIEVDSQIIKVFDPSLHEEVTRVASSSGASVRREEFDRRWVPCRRPVVVTGGELTLDMLDLKFNEYAMFYEAPLHMKAFGGTFIVDDLGRQFVRPDQLLNRWIIPLENGVDFLKLHTGKSFCVPFDELVIFATNLQPADLMDAAFLRRIPYKLRIDPPSRPEYCTIFHRVAEANGLTLGQDNLSLVFETLAETGDGALASYQPKFIVDQVISACKYAGVSPELTRERVAHALDNLFVRTSPAPPKVCSDGGSETKSVAA